MRTMGAAPPEPPPAPAPAPASRAAPAAAPAPAVQAVATRTPPAAPPPKAAPPKVAASPPPAPPSPPTPVAMASAALSAPPAKLSAADAQLTLQLQGLQHEVARSRKRLWILGGAAAALLLLLIGILIWRHYAEVFQFAEISSVEFHPTSPGASVEIAYTAKSAGRFEITRTTSRQTEQLTDFIAEKSGDYSQQRFFWRDQNPEPAQFRVRFRSGWSLKEQAWPAK